MEATFESLGLSDAMLKALEKKGYGWPTTIQQLAIPEFMQWKDVIAKAPTGTGKTCCNVAIRLAIHAFLSLCFRAMSLFNALPFFHNNNILLCAFSEHFYCGKNSRRTCSNN